jgi:hypothetical protein
VIVGAIPAVIFWVGVSFWFFNIHNPNFCNFLDFYSTNTAHVKIDINNSFLSHVDYQPLGDSKKKSYEAST